MSDKFSNIKSIFIQKKKIEKQNMKNKFMLAT